MAKRWQKVELNYLKKHAGSKSLEELAERFHTDVATVEAKIRDLRPERLGAAAKAEEKALDEFQKGMEALYAEKWKKAHDILETLAEEAQIADLAARARQYADLAQRRLDETEPDDPYLAAVVAKNRGEYEAAAKICSQGKRATKDARFAYLAAAIASRQGDLAAASKHLEKAIELDPRNRNHARHDPDFQDFREHAEHGELLAV